MQQQIFSFRLIVFGLLLYGLTSCEKAINLKNPDSTPVAVFDEAWKVMDERYAMFSFKEVDWKSVYTTYRQQVTDDMTDKALFDVLARMLETLKDGHVALLSDTDTAVYQNFYATFPANFNYPNLLKNYLGNDYKKVGPVIYKVLNNIGYLYYDAFANDISDSQLNSIFTDIAPTEGLIVDVRNNTGGNVDNANRLFARFISGKFLLKYNVNKAGPGHDDFTAHRPIYLEPAGSYYNNSVIVLTNRRCFSACNDFVMYMSGLANVQLMGDQTGGGGGVPHNYLMANGWKLQYSSSATLSPEKRNIENGITPDVSINITPIEETAGRDPIIEKAYESLQ